MEARPKTKKAFDNITDTFTGADGGVSFINLRFFIEGLDAKASEGDAESEEILQIMKQFSMLIDIANYKE